MTSNIWFTSDTHFGHKRIIELCNRPFRDVEHMNAQIVKNFNSVIAPGDTLIHLGDVALGTIAESLPIVGQINGIKFLVPGNHDRIFSGEPENKRARFLPEYKKVFNQIWPESSEGSFGIAAKPFALSHFPYVGDSHGADRHADKRPVDNGLPIVHGHVHEEWRKNGRMLNVGVDVWDFFPVHESTVVDWLNTL